MSGSMQAFPPIDTQDFWDYLDTLVASSQVVFDRPRGTAHPRYPDMIYPLDYGYLEGTTASDGGGIDVWAGSLDCNRLDAVVLTVDLLKRDTELKLLLGCTPAEAQTIVDFLNGFSMRALLVPRSPDPLALLRSRHSVRRFTDQPVPEDVLAAVLQAATWAPSAHNRQPWRCAVLTSPESKARLAGEMGAEFHCALLADGLAPDEAAAQVERSRQRIQQAPAAVLLCLDPSAGDDYPDPTRRQAELLMGVQSVAMAGQNLLLAAHALGLGGVWVCAPLFAPQAARCALDLPETWQPQGLLLLGYPARPAEPRPRRPVDEMARFY